MISSFRIFIAIFTVVLAAVVSLAQTTQLKPDNAASFSLQPKQSREFTIALKLGDVCDVHVNVDARLFLEMDVIDPSGRQMLKGGDALQGYLFIAESAGTYRIIVKNSDTSPENSSNSASASIRYSNKLNLPKNAKTTATRAINGYTAKITDEAGDDASTYLTIQKGGKTVGIMRAEKEITGGFYFSDDPSKFTPKASVALMKSTLDKTGDGTPDVAVEYYSGGAHCCFEITFFELGERVRQLPTIYTDNDQLTAYAKKPGGGLRFRASEQAFAYWAIAFAFSPMPTVIYEFDKSDDLVPRFDLMKKPAPMLTKLKRDAAATRAKLNLNPYTSPEDNFNDFEEPFWGEMLDLIYTGHEDLAWQYFEMVWPAKKPGKDKFLADFKEQLALTAYSSWKNRQGH
jgi:hypothetical protein